MKKLNIILIITLLFTFSCKKDSHFTELRGSVYDFYTGYKIVNINLMIKETTLDPSNPQLMQLPYDTTSYVQKVKVDGNGNFKLSTEFLEEGKNYILIYSDSKKFSIYSNVIKVWEENYFNLKLKHYNALDVEVYNTINADRVEMKLSVDNTHKEETSEIVQFLLNANRYTYVDPNSKIRLKSIPDCAHIIHVKYLLDGVWSEETSIEKFVSNVDTTQAKIVLL